MADTFQFDLVSPERSLISAQVREVIVPGAEGDFTVLVRHAPLVAMLRPGILRVPDLDGRQRDIFVHGGFAEVGPDSLTVLAEQAVPIEDFDQAMIDQQIQDAREDVADAKDEDTRRQAEDNLERLTTLKEVLRMGG